MHLGAGHGGGYGEFLNVATPPCAASALSTRAATTTDCTPARSDALAVRLRLTCELLPDMPFPLPLADERAVDERAFRDKIRVTQYDTSAIKLVPRSREDSWQASARASPLPRRAWASTISSPAGGLLRRRRIDVELDLKMFRGTQSSWKDINYFERPQDKPYTEGRDVIQGACAWGSICNASAGMGRFVPDAYGVSPWAIFVRPDSKIRTSARPEGRADRGRACAPAATSTFRIGWRNICRSKTSRPSTPAGSARDCKALLNGEVDAASLLPPQIAMAEQLGLRKIIEDRFHTLWWVPESADPEDRGRATCARSTAPKRRWMPI